MAAPPEATEVQIAEAVAVLPPRPDAIVTFLSTDDFLSGAQTLLYSVKVRLHSTQHQLHSAVKSCCTPMTQRRSLSLMFPFFLAPQKALPKTQTPMYPPELVVLVTPNVSQSTRQALHPAFCTRIIEVEPLAFPESSLHSKQVVSSHVESWEAQGGLTKLHIFRLEVYDTILYLDADCLVVKDVSHLLELGKVYVESEALIAAAPDIMPPDKFNAGVLVVRPSQSVFDNMMAQASLLATYDGGDTGFLNAYFPEWYTEMPPMARLKFGYNAQRFLFHCTYEKQPNYWDLAVAPDLHVIHFSSSPKPWETMGKPKQEVQEHLAEGDVRQLRKYAKSSELEVLWRKWYQRSQNYAEKYRKEREKETRQSTAAASLPRQEVAPSNPNEVHKLVTKRYKELRREGKPTNEAMKIAREEYGLDKGDGVSAAAQVAAMFGMM